MTDLYNYECPYAFFYDDPFLSWWMGRVAQIEHYIKLATQDGDLLHQGVYATELYRLRDDTSRLRCGVWRARRYAEQAYSRMKENDPYLTELCVHDGWKLWDQARQTGTLAVAMRSL